ncbi:MULTISPECIES: response regulator transcription factor [Burkholderia]|uniref:response regulator transcription factor n=1 Tax=Burkholderia TaxID=32008 RepID=UPI00158F07FF|nr:MULTISPECIES: response regulator transcription factor [Burkholderia]MCU9952230.1 response regulator transcription factor [Burkholderia sp. BKH01]
MCDTSEVLFVDGDELQSCLVGRLLLRGYTVEHQKSGSAAMRRLAKGLPAVVVLERRLPDVDGLGVLAWIRARFPDLPVIVLGSAVLEHEVVSALRAGADDFVRKPVLEDEFVARITALLRRHHRPALDVIEIGHLFIDMRAKEVSVAGDLVRLTQIEYQIVELLARDIGVVIPRETIASRVWRRPDVESVSRSLDTHIFRIRRKLRLHTPRGSRCARPIRSGTSLITRDASYREGGVPATATVSTIGLPDTCGACRTSGRLAIGDEVARFAHSVFRWLAARFGSASTALNARMSIHFPLPPCRRLTPTRRSAIGSTAAMKCKFPVKPCARCNIRNCCEIG